MRSHIVYFTYIINICAMSPFFVSFWRVTR